MRRSKLLPKLKSGQIVTCVKSNLSDHRTIEIACKIGFDCIWVDIEHTANDWSAVEKQILATKVYDTDILVRVPRSSYSDLIKPFELDATGIMVPHCMSYEDAVNIQRMSRFYPIGRRPVDGGSADAEYGTMEFKEYIIQSNAEKFVIVQIEDPEVLVDIEKICSLEGIDMIFFGPGDFSHSIGVPGEWDNKEVARVRSLIPKIAAKYGKYAGTVSSFDTYESLIDMGYNFLNIGVDVIGVAEYFLECKKTFESILVKNHPKNPKI